MSVSKWPLTWYYYTDIEKGYCVKLLKMILETCPLTWKCKLSNITNNIFRASIKVFKDFILHHSKTLDLNIVYAVTCCNPEISLSISWKLLLTLVYLFVWNRIWEKRLRDGLVWNRIREMWKGRKALRQVRYTVITVAATGSFFLLLDESTTQKKTIQKTRHMHHKRN